MWYLASTDKERKKFASSTGLKSFESKDLRKPVIVKMKSMIAHHSKHMPAYSRFETFEETIQHSPVNPTICKVDNLCLDESDVCDICCEIITDSTDCHKFTSCTHKFYHGCLQSWQNNDYMLTCPTCLTYDFQTSGLADSVITDIKSQGTPVNDNCKDWVRSDDNNQCEVANHQLQIRNRDYANKQRHLSKDKPSKKWLLGAKKVNNISISDFVAVSFNERNHGNWMSACLIRIVFNIGKGGGYGVNVVSKHGILAKNLNTKFPETSVIPMEKYDILILMFPVCKQLSDICVEVMNGAFDGSKHQLISSK